MEEPGPGLNKKEDQLALYEELIDVWLMLREAMPLALSTLNRGGVAIPEQVDFWSAVRKLEQFADIIDYAGDGTGGGREIDARIDELTGLADRLQE